MIQNKKLVPAFSNMENTAEYPGLGSLKQRQLRKIKKIKGN